MLVAGASLVPSGSSEFHQAAGARGVARCRISRRVAVLLISCLALPWLAVAASSPGRSWSVEEIENFLAKAEILDLRSLREGVTNTTRATLSEGNSSHDAQIQQVDISKPSYATAKGWELNFRDYWGYNIAAYRLSRMLNLHRVPVSVRREIDGKGAAVTWWIDDVLMTEKTRFVKKIRPPDVDDWNRQMYTVWVFDQLIYNTDRNLGNLVITADWKIWMIDHTRAFRVNSDLQDPKQPVLCERSLLEAMRRLEPTGLSQQLGQYLTSDEIKTLLARRDKIVDYFDRQIALRGEAKVLFESARR
jgi:hypothetical protein